ncbi:hypothetical protein [Lactiplantibacillus plantarum]|uniref:hypothetical protein n=1 Tax=Lactiplantibacillus plantarum TaxID=1590 RepID=UPI001BA9BF73|nr:hypothetical protein [Lactiplantibacillus plantarum]MBS0936618.1 hypothetical protein [Lactiplantibacillus plantarum]MBS0943801.1 hypothetical protein [Lactiplantibacillus plantarum]
MENKNVIQTSSVVLSRQSWKLRSKPNHRDRLPIFLQQNFVGGGWPDTKSLAGLNFQEIKEKVNKAYAAEKYSERKLGYTAGVLFSLTQIKKDDYILIPHENREVLIFIATNGYRYNQKFANVDCAHQVPVLLLKKVPYSALSDELRNSLNSYKTLTSLSKYQQEIDNLINPSAPIKTTLNAGLSFNGKANNHHLKLTVDTGTTANELDSFIEQVKNARLFQNQSI